MTAPAHAGTKRRFEREVDPDGILPPVERAIRAARAQRSWMLRLAQKSADARRARRAG